MPGSVGSSGCLSPSGRSASPRGDARSREACRGSRPPRRPEASLELPVRWSDLDANGHVNNLAYVAWVVESVPRDVLRASAPRSLEISFRAECRDEADVAVERGRDAAESRDGRDVFRHRIVERGSGRELALARTEWLVQVHH